MSKRKRRQQEQKEDHSELWPIYFLAVGLLVANILDCLGLLDWYHRIAQEESMQQYYQDWAKNTKQWLERGW